jgi:hemerythrin
MSTFAWNESYSVHVQQFDAQHQKLFEIINSLSDAMRVGKGEDVIRDVVAQLAVYTRTHFLQEEVLMRQTGYPDLAAHHDQHTRLMSDVEKYKADLDEGANPTPLPSTIFSANGSSSTSRNPTKAIPTTSTPTASTDLV